MRNRIQPSTEVICRESGGQTPNRIDGLELAWAWGSRCCVFLVSALSLLGMREYKEIEVKPSAIFPRVVRLIVHFNGFWLVGGVVIQI